MQAADTSGEQQANATAAPWSPLGSVGSGAEPLHWGLKFHRRQPDSPAVSFNLRLSEVLPWVGGGGPWIGSEEGQEPPEPPESKHSDLLRGPHGLQPPRLERRASQKEVCSAFTRLKSPDSAPIHLEQS